MFEIPVYVRQQFIVTFCANLGHIVVGYGVGWNAPVIPKLQNLDESPLPDTISLTEASWLGSSYFIGGILGPIIFAKFSTIIGRKTCLLVANAISVIGSIMRIFATNFPILIAGRIIAGFGTGIIGIINLVYIGEIASPNIRGIMLSSTAVFHTFGSLIIYSAGPFVSYKEIEYIFLCLCGLYLIGLLFIPESPLHHILKGNTKAAMNVLKHLGRDENIDEELKSLSDNVAEIAQNKFEIKEIFILKSNRKSFIITCALCMFQECSGLLAISNFLMTIFQKAGSSVQPDIATMIVGVTQFFVASLAPLFIDCLGRKCLLLISTTGCAVSMTILGVYFYLDFINDASISHVGWLPLAAVELAYCAYSIGLNIVPNTLLAEMYRPNVRSIGTTISMNSGWIAGLISVMCFGYIVEALGIYVVFWLYAVINLIGFVFVYLVVPETKGLSLTEIENMLSK